MDSNSDTATRRLFVSAALSVHAARSLKGRIPLQSKGPDLLAAARRLGAEAELLEERYRLRFEPPFPGASGGAQEVGGGMRLVLGCAVSAGDGTPLGVAFTTLISGRTPQVSVAPVGAGVPEEWRRLGDLP